MKALPLQSLLSPRAWQGAYEDDPEFRELMGEVSRRGMVAAGLFGMVLTGIHVLAHVAFVGKSPAWSYGGGDAIQTIVLWDKLFIAVLSLAMIQLARMDLPMWVGRLISGSLVIAICAAILVDDVINGDVHFSAAWFALVLLAAVNTIPFTAWQTFLLGMATVALLSAGLALMPPIPGMSGIEHTLSQAVYLTMVTVLVTGLSALIYRYRYEQFVAHRSADALARSLERRTEELEEEQRKTAEQTDRLVEMEGLKARVFSNISHEFRTPLTLIAGPLDEALRGRYGPLPPELQARHRAMQTSARRLLHLVDQLLDLAKVDAGRMELKERAGDLVGLLQGLVEAFTPLAEREQVGLHFHADTDALRMRFDPEKVEQVFSNLLSNAIKFTGAGGKVLVTLSGVGGARDPASGAPGWVEVAVRDTGPGIPADEAELIFDRFHRLAQAQPGTGLGLALARELAQLHGGTLRLESEVGFGSTFTVRLPFRSAPEGGPHEPEPTLSLDHRVLEHEDLNDELPDASEVEGERPLVLVVDDNADLRAYLRALLTPQFQVVEAPDCPTALERAHALRPDLILLDVMMPELDGYALCRTLKTDPLLQHIPVVMLTARASEDDVVEGLREGADDYVSKPFQPEALRARLHNLIASRRALRHRFSREIVVQPSGVVIQDEDEAFVQRVIELVEGQLGESTFNVDTMASDLGMSRRQLERRLREVVGESPAELVRRMRLERAAQLLRANAGTVAEVGYEVGFRSPSHFSAAFRSAYGVPPTAYTERQEP
jgi:signal transduction histidine kinase/DNA-binding response OmpR family regulator